MNKSVSITIPCKNEEKYIAQCLQSIVDADYSKEHLKVLVVDGRSEDSTRKIIASYQEKYSWISMIDNPKKVTPVALNLGLKAVDSEVKIILGAHSTIDKNFIRRNIDVLAANPEVGCSGGVIENVNENQAAEITALAMASPFGVGNAHFRTGEKDGYVDTVAFGAYRKEVFEKIGYFDEELVRNQDDEFNYRLLKNGFKIYLDREIKSNYFVRGDFKKLFVQYFQYGYWKVYVNRKHKAITTVRQLIPLFFVLYIFIGLVASVLFLKLIVLYVLGCIAYLAMGFYFALKKTNRVATAIRVVKVFCILHYSYGYGYLKGIINFIVLNKKPSAKNTKLSR